MSASHSERGTLVLVGFFGRGNAGDEAMLQCIHEVFSPRFDIIISVDHTDAFDGFWDWHPYLGTKLVHQCDLGFLDVLENASGILVGGGGFPVGFAAGQVMAAMAKGMPAAIAGVDLWNPNEEAASGQRRAMAQWLGLFDHVLPRTALGVRNAKVYGAHPIPFADWALRLPVDQCPDVWDTPNRALVVMREDIATSLPPDHRENMVRLLLGITDCGYSPLLLPFSPEDERFAVELGLNEIASIERSWWNPSRLKQMIACSGLTVTVGRLHPIIFSAGTGQKIAAIAQPTINGTPLIGKISDMASELGIGHYNDVDTFLGSLRNGKVKPASAPKVAAAKKRLEFGIQMLHGLFTPRD